MKEEDIPWRAQISISCVPTSAACEEISKTLSSEFACYDDIVSLQVVLSVEGYL
jgi:hypothetical protein